MKFSELADIRQLNSWPDQWWVAINGVCAPTPFNESEIGFLATRNSMIAVVNIAQTSPETQDWYWIERTVEIIRKHEKIADPEGFFQMGKQNLDRGTVCSMCRKSKTIMHAGREWCPDCGRFTPLPAAKPSPVKAPLPLKTQKPAPKRSIEQARPVPLMKSPAIRSPRESHQNAQLDVVITNYIEPPRTLGDIARSFWNSESFWYIGGISAVVGIFGMFYSLGSSYPKKKISTVPYKNEQSDEEFQTLKDSLNKKDVYLGIIREHPDKAVFDVLPKTNSHTIKEDTALAAAKWQQFIDRFPMSPLMTEALKNKRYFQDKLEKEEALNASRIAFDAVPLLDSEKFNAYPQMFIDQKVRVNGSAVFFAYSSGVGSHQTYKLGGVYVEMPYNISQNIMRSSQGKKRGIPCEGIGTVKRGGRDNAPLIFIEKIIY